MRPPAVIKNWLSIEEMFQWVQNAPDKKAYACRMAIWLTHTGKLHAAKVADILDVSKQAVWLWIRQYNQEGPSGLDRQGRGGRRWGLMTPQQEKEFVLHLRKHLASGEPLKVSHIKRIVENSLQKKVSMSYVYKLLTRHNIPIQPSSRPTKTSTVRKDTFGVLSMPWLRNS